MTTNQKTIVTHNGSHHADDVFGVAVLRMVLRDNVVVVRTRDPAIIAKADYVVDVGGEWDVSRGRFDHHQRGFSGSREGVTYASAGLVWAAYGHVLVKYIEPTLTAEQVEQVWLQIDRNLVQHLDNDDTGSVSAAPGVYGFSAILSLFNLSRQDEKGVEQVLEEAGRLERKEELVAQMRDLRFEEATGVVREILTGLIKQYADEALSADMIRQAATLHGGKVLVLPESGLNWISIVCQEMPEVLLVIYPDSTDKQYQLRTVPISPQSYTARMDLPASWSGLRDEALANETGVSDAVFCHTNLFIAGAQSLDGVSSLATKALVSAGVLKQGAEGNTWNFVFMEGTTKP